MASQTQKPGAAGIAARIRRDIVDGELRCHERLPSERQLAETFAVARGTVREALTRLASEAYVEIRPGSGTYVIYAMPEPTSDAISTANPLELIDARFALEPHICRLAVLHGRRTDFEALDALCSEMERYGEDPQRFSDADTAFHRVLAETTRNGLLIWIIGQINVVRNQDDWTRMRSITLDAAIIAQYNTQHRMILDAIRAREPERAANIMKEHLETARASLMRAADA